MKSAHTTFLIENNTIVNVNSSMHIQGIPIGFKFPYAGEEFDMYALNGKGYMVLGKSWEGGMTIYADTLIETATDTIFTNKNKFLISGLYTGKNLEYVSYLMFNTENVWGFPGEKKTRVGFENYYYNNLNGAAFSIMSFIEFAETGEIIITNQIQTINTNEVTNTYATFLQRDGSSNTQSLAGTGADTDSWWNTVQTYSANDIQFGFLSNTVKPKIIYGNVLSSPARVYTICYKPLNPVYHCPVVLDIEDSKYKSEFILYPNPAANTIQISGINNTASIILYNVEGKKVFETTSTDHQRLVLPYLPASMYYVKIEDAERSLTLKLIIK